MITISIEIN